MGKRSAAIVVSAGQGLRFGGLKQLEMLGDKRVIDASLAVAKRCVDYVVCVKVPGVDFGNLNADVVVDGGATRSDSVRAGLYALPSDTQVVLVHDGARPFASPNLYYKILDRLNGGSKAVIPVIAMSDTVKEVSGEMVLKTIDRSRIVRVQTPQGFQRDILDLAYKNHIDATDDSYLVETLGVIVETISGEDVNFKITTQADLNYAKEIYEETSSV